MGKKNLKFILSALLFFNLTNLEAQGKKAACKENFANQGDLFSEKDASSSFKRKVSGSIESFVQEGSLLCSVKIYGSLHTS